jgi:hypothetical protein
MLGVILYFQLGRIVELRVSLAVVNLASILSFSMTMLGLLATLIGVAVWARRAPRGHLLWSGLSVGLASLLLGLFGNINVHGTNGILALVVLAGAFVCVLILVVGAGRLGQAKTQNG